MVGDREALRATPIVSHGIPHLYLRTSAKSTSFAENWGGRVVPTFLPVVQPLL